MPIIEVLMHVMLNRLAELTRQQVRTRQTLIGAMVYPCVLVVIAFNVLITMLCFVMPRVSGLFKTLDTPLPPTTKVLSSSSRPACTATTPAVTIGGIPASSTEVRQGISPVVPATMATRRTTDGSSTILVAKHHKAA